ncbi:hypothetical protein [Nonlabens sp.]|uniref:hypothetical protein n=1 Tax=Nonlabens sp. TaxID=1888209 RepID=UPI003F69791C
MATLRQYSIMNRSFFMAIIMVIFAFAKAYSQRNSSDIIFENSKITTVNINLESTIELEIVTTDSQSIRITDSQGGEYKNALTLNSSIINDTLQISDPFHASFKFPQDKLSAHKIIDDQAKLYLPEGLDVQLTARSCFLKVTGNYKNLFINIESGDCELSTVRSPFHIITVYADVNIINPETTVQINSKNGTIKPAQLKNMKSNSHKIETIHGSITIKD